MPTILEKFAPTPALKTAPAPRSNREENASKLLLAAGNNPSSKLYEKYHGFALKAMKETDAADEPLKDNEETDNEHDKIRRLDAPSSDGAIMPYFL